jgi:hypothetical protein
MKREQRQILVGIDTKWLRSTAMAVLFEFEVKELSVIGGDPFDPNLPFHVVVADGISLEDNFFAKLAYHNKAGRRLEFFVPKDKIVFMTWMENLEDASKLGFSLRR